jgi:hypothetical protein
MAVALIAALLILSCNKDKSNGPGDTDQIPPGAILDLICTDSVGESLTLRWTAPGDDNDSGRASSYDLRFSLGEITDSNWDQATIVEHVPHPQAAGATETLELPEVTWWTSYHIALKTQDDAGNWSALSNVLAVSPGPDTGLRLIVRTKGGAYVSTLDGDTAKFAGDTGPIEVRGNHIFIVQGFRNIKEYDPSGSLLNTVPIPDTAGAHDFVALPDGGFATLDNNRDVVGFIDGTGQWLGETAMGDSADNNLQIVSGVIAGDQLIVSEDGHYQLLRVDLTSHAITIFKDLSRLGDWLGAIDYHGGEYYLCQPNRIQRFTATGDPALVATLGVSNLTGIVVAGGYSFVTVNFANAVYRVNNTTGEVAVIIEGLQYPQDIEMFTE